MSRDDVETILLKHFKKWLPEVGAGVEIDRYLKLKRNDHLIFLQVMYDHYRKVIRADINPMISKTELARLLGLSSKAIQGYWFQLRAWKICGIQVFSDGVHALRQGTWTVDGEQRLIIHPGIALRMANQNYPSPKWAQKIMESTAETARVAMATTGYASQMIQESDKATIFQKKRAREVRASTLFPLGQLEMPLFAKKKSA